MKISLNHSVEKNVWISSRQILHLIPCLFHVWTPGGCMSDTPETMGGLSGSTYLCSLIDIIKPREQNSLLSAIEITADSSSDICFARFNNVYEGAQVSAAQKSYKLSHGVRT